MVTEDEDSRFRTVAYAIALMALVYILFNVAALAAIYWGDERATPPWDERSVPPPQTE